MLNRVREYMYRHLPDDRELRFRASLLLGILLTVLVLTTAEFLFFALIANVHMDDTTRRWSLLLIGVAGLLFLGMMVLLLRGYFLLVSIGTAGIVTVGICIAVFFTSGAPASPALPLLLSAAVTCFCLLGVRVGVVMGIGLPLLAALQWTLSVHWGWQLPALQSHKNPVIDVVLISVVNYLTVMIVVLVYERINARLRQERDEERERLAHLATHDELTSLANRRYFHQRLEQACARSDRGGHAVTVLYIDLDGFKKINDDLGHRSGDAALVEIAARLKAVLRRQDLVGRLGGDEFAIIIDPAGSPQETDCFCARLRSVVAQPLQIGDGSYAVGASIGTVFYPGEVADVEHLLNHADAAMYREKRRHRGDPA